MFMLFLLLFSCQTQSTQKDTASPEEKTDTSPDFDDYESTALIMPYVKCSEPMEGDEEYAIDGEICVNVFISGASPFGTSFADYGSCEDVLTNRPGGDYPVTNDSQPDDPRLQDAEFVTELQWAKEQQQATACSCCHSSNVADEIGLYDIDSGSIWTDSMSDRGLAIMSGDVDSAVLGFYHPEDNHGFARTEVGAPTTDLARWKSFFRDELDRRGVTAEDIANMAPLTGWLIDNQEDEGRDCVRDFEGVEPDGSIIWTGSEIRYLYIMRPGEENPGLPPTFDTPESVVWRIDVHHTQRPLASGSVYYGEVPEGASQAFPTDGEPEALVPGEEYRMWLLSDMGLPVQTHCRFTY